MNKLSSGRTVPLELVHSVRFDVLGEVAEEMPDQPQLQQISKEVARRSVKRGVSAPARGTER